MPAHLHRRKDRGSYWYIIDGEHQETTKTKNRSLAQERLKQYIRGQFGLLPSPTVGEFYSTWIGNSAGRAAYVVSSRQHFNAYILPKFAHVRLTELRTGLLSEFKAGLSKRGLAVKTVRNIIDGTFRALFRDARRQIHVLEGRDPFKDIDWPSISREPPDPFTAEERDAIIAWWRESDFFYFPWVFALFHTGMRPSEAAALKWRYSDLDQGYVWIYKSRYMNENGNPKTVGSRRKLPISPAVVEVMRLLPSQKLGLEYIFVNKEGGPINAKKWSQHYWGKCLKLLGIRHRKFYATRHTFITEVIRRGLTPADLLNLPRYCGTSVKMIMEDYCGVIPPAFLGISEPSAPNPSINMVAGPGFEPMPAETTTSDNRLTTLESYKFRRVKTA